MDYSLFGLAPASVLTSENYSYIPDISKETLDKHKQKMQREEKIRAAIWEWPKSSGNLYMLGSDKLVYDYMNKD